MDLGLICSNLPKDFRLHYCSGFTTDSYMLLCPVLPRNFVEQLLGEDGPFQTDEYLKTKLGSSFFLALTEASPVARSDAFKEP